VFYLNRKYKKIKVLPKDYLIFYNTEKRIKKIINLESLSNFKNKIKKALVFLSIKFLQRLKTDAIRLQLFFENLLNKIKSINDNLE